jgi:asparagine synthase (glutamine-hydrolysing)
MCGIAGIARANGRVVETLTLRRMAAAIRHRGPDDIGVVSSQGVGIAHVRLGILDLIGGAQPMATEDGRVVLAFNGEVFNHDALRSELRSHGHQFRSRSDTEVVLRGYEQWGADLPNRLNGQFAFVVHDRRTHSVFMARDRFGMLPLFYATRGSDLYFASEIKGLFASGELEAAPDLQGLDQVFTMWSALAPRTAFRGVSALEPGCCAVWRAGSLSVRRYYELEFPVAGDEPTDALEHLDDLMQSAVQLRMAADVPVGGYLSGGLDSSSVCALAAAAHREPLRTFSVSFDDPRYDESPHQCTAAAHLRSAHAVQAIAAGDIARVFPDVVYHAETPLLRTAPAPMFLLSKLARDEHVKVVLTGEGADETFLGYDLFKDTLVRLFCLRRPQSMLRPRLFERLYPNERGGTRRSDFWARYFLTSGSPSDPLFSHLPRFRTTSWIKDFYSYDTRVALHEFDALDDLRSRLPQRFASWTPLARATYLEMRTLLDGYLLSSQGDRMAMAHGVETRTPFLDHRLVEFAVSLPEASRLRGLREKEILRRWARTVLPGALAARSKQAYRAPDVPHLLGPVRPEYFDLLTPDAVDRVGIFDSRAVSGLVRRCSEGAVTSTRESQALVGILSTQLWHDRFIAAARPDTRSAELAGVANA